MPQIDAAITLGKGVKRPKGRRIKLRGDHIGGIEKELVAHAGGEAWLSPHTWGGDRRARKRWEASVGVFIDIDVAQHGVLSPEGGAAAIEALRETANLSYLTPHGVRAIVLFDRPVTDRDLYQRAAQGAADRIEQALASAGVEDLLVDRPATADLARLFFAPNASVKCRHGHPECSNPERRAEVHRLREELWSAKDLGPSPRARQEAAASRRSSVGGPESVRDVEQLAMSILDHEGSKRGKEIRFRCALPGHADKTPSARFNVEKGAWFCDVCGRGGSWRDLARRRGLRVSRAQSDLRKRTKQRMSALRPTDDRKEILYHDIDSDIPLHVLTPRAATALTARCIDRLYTRGNQLVRVVSGGEHSTKTIRRGAGPRIELLPESVLREELDYAARWIAIRKGKQGPVRKETWAPRPVVLAVRDRGSWPGLRVLDAVVESPTLRPDGSVFDTPGYDAATTLLYQPAREYPGIPERPCEQQVLVALQLLLGPFREFRFETEADLASLIALLLTIAGRFAVDGSVPHWAIMAPSFGAGKTLLGEASTVAMTGSEPDSMAPVGGRMADAEAEMRKRLTTVVLESPRVALIDNVPDGATFDSKSFAMLLTATIWTDRLLGKNEKVSLRHTTVWLSTGCNYRLAGDLARRSLSIVIDPAVEDPHRRKFEIGNLVAHVRERHPELLAAAMTILRGFVVAGRPRLSHAPLGRFESWDGLVRGAVIWATGLAGTALDPVESAARLQNEAPDRDGLIELVEAWQAAFPDSPPVTARELVTRAKSDRRLCEAIVGIGGCSKGDPDARALGNRLRVFSGRVVRGAVLRQVGKRQGVALWRIAPSSAGGTCGSRGSFGGSSVFDGKVEYAKNGIATTGPTRATSPTPTPAEDPENGGRQPRGTSRASGNLASSQPEATATRCERESFEERAAILEYEAGFSREEAERRTAELTQAPDVRPTPARRGSRGRP